MSYNVNSLKIWYLKLKNHVEPNERKIELSNLTDIDTEEDEDEEEEDEDEEENEEENEEAGQMYQNEKKEETDNLEYAFKTLNELFKSLCSLTTINCFMLCFLLNYMLQDEKLSGLLFILSTISILTCTIFYYPAYRLISTGILHLRLIKWIYITLVFAIFFHYVKEHIQFCSTTGLAISIGFKLFKELPESFPNTFTYTELMIVSTIGSCGSFTFLVHVYKILRCDVPEVVIVEHALAWLLLTLFLVKKLPIMQESLIAFSFGCVFVLLFYFLPIIYLSLKENAFLWLYNYIFNNGIRRIFLFLYWIILFTLMTLLIMFKRLVVLNHEQTKHLKNVKKDKQIELIETIYLTQIRKLFHFLICLVYCLGFVYDRYLLYLCSYGMLILLILIEIIRYLNVGVISQIIQEIMTLFLDEKDMKSKLILSHIYLLVGFSFPLWISNLNEFKIAQLSGLITVGISDSFASIIGSKFGRLRWPGNKKSIEGSMAFIISQFLVFLLLNYFKIFELFSFNNFMFIFLNLLLTCFAETFTNDNDNLILPIISYPFLCLIK